MDNLAWDKTQQSWQIRPSRNFLRNFPETPQEKQYFSITGVLLNSPNSLDVYFLSFLLEESFCLYLRRDGKSMFGLFCFSILHIGLCKNSISILKKKI